MRKSNLSFKIYFGKITDMNTSKLKHSQKPDMHNFWYIRIQLYEIK